MSPQGARGREEAFESRPALEAEEAGQRLPLGEDIGAAVGAVRDDGDDGDARGLRHPHEAGALAEDHLIAAVGVAIGIEVAAGIDQHLSAALEGAERVARRRAHGPEALEHRAEGRDLPHREVVGQGVERRFGPTRVPERGQRAAEIGPGDTAVVIANVERRPAREAVEPLFAEAEVTLVGEPRKRQDSGDELGIACVEPIGVEGPEVLVTDFRSASSIERAAPAGAESPAVSMLMAGTVACASPARPPDRARGRGKHDLRLCGKRVRARPHGACAISRVESCGKGAAPAGRRRSDDDLARAPAALPRHDPRREHRWSARSAWCESSFSFRADTRGTPTGLWSRVASARLMTQSFIPGAPGLWASRSTPVR